MSVPERRGFAALAHGPLHLRWRGRGPALLLLHQAPQHGGMWRERMAALAAEWLTVAPDLPGFGHSAPLPAPSIRGFAEALLAALDALGLDRFVVFGMHTGGLVAAELGRLAPGRVAAVLVDGYAWFTPEEQAELDERYLPPFEPRWDGSHLAWLWARLREQRLYFPWYDGRAERALALDAPAPEATHAAALEFLLAGEAHRPAYRAALADRERDRILALRVPARLWYRRDDPLAAHRVRLPPLPAGVEARELADRGELGQALAAALAELRPSLAPARPRPLPETRANERRGIAGGRLPLAYRELGEGEDFELWLSCPTAPDEALAEARAAPGARRLLPEWPGQGASELPRGRLGRRRLLAALVALVARRPGRLRGIRAFGAAAPLALELAERLGSRLALRQPWLLSAAERAWLLEHLPDQRPRPGGGQLLAAWEWARDAFLFPPWWPPLGRHRRKLAAPAPEAVHRRMLAALLPGRRFRALLAACLAPGAARPPVAIEPHPALAGRGLEALS